MSLIRIMRQQLSHLQCKHKRNNKYPALKFYKIPKVIICAGALKPDSILKIRTFAVLRKIIKFK